LKELAGIPDEIKLIAPEFIEPVQKMKMMFKEKNCNLTIDEVLIALSIYANKDANAAKALNKVNDLKGCEVHLSIIPNGVNEATYRKLGVNMTCEPKYQTSCMYHI
ncbi:MAG: DUF1846 family protein, partial [Candidatus Methanomethylophilaceae archaeon]|nr:DUF1846 family protein [Candidatus Methanomethylophilaceae archaeon]